MARNKIASTAFQTVFETIFPPQCVACNEMVAESGGLCADCWCETHFIGGLVCDKCGSPLIGEESDTPELCDDCTTVARPWGHGRAALIYKGAGRRLVLGLKHADRTEVAKPAGKWLARSGACLVTTSTIISPIPLHRSRFFKRRYNQSALLATAFAKSHQVEVVPDLLTRTKKTRSLDGLTKNERFEVLQSSIQVTDRFKTEILNRDILLVDDVMTSGATFAAATEACLAAGAKSVCILALARVVKDA